MAEENGVWRTIRGRRVFIRDGEDLASAMQRSGKFNNLKRADVFKGKQELENRRLHKQTRDMEDGRFNNRHRYGEDYWNRELILAQRFEREGKELIDKYDEGFGEAKVSKTIDDRATTRTNRYRNYNTEHYDPYKGTPYERKYDSVYEAMKDPNHPTNKYIEEKTGKNPSQGLRQLEERRAYDEYKKAKAKTLQKDATMGDYRAMKEAKARFEDIKDRNSGMTKQEEQFNWRKQVEANNKQMQKDLEVYEKEKDPFGKNLHNEEIHSGYYEIYRNNERANAKIKVEEPNEKYENVQAYAGYKDKFDKTWGDGSTKTVSASMYTNDEFMEHLEDANWHSERKQLLDAGLTNKQLEYVKANTNVSAWSADLDRTKTERLINEAKEKYPVSNGIEAKAKIERFKQQKGNINDIVNDDNKSISYSFRTDKRDMFTVRYNRTGNNKNMDFATTASRFNRNRTDYEMGGQAQKEILKEGSKAKSFYDKWDNKHLGTLTNAEYDDLLKDIEVMKKTYPYIEGDRFYNQVELDRSSSKTISNYKRRKR